MTDRTTSHLTAAGFIETRPRNFERNGILIEYTPNGTKALMVRAPYAETLPSFATDYVSHALMAAQIFENLEAAVSSLVSETFDTVSTYMIGEYSLDRSIELEKDINPADMSQLRSRVERLLGLALEAAQEAGRLPAEGPGETPAKARADRWLTTVRGEGSNAFIRTATIHRTKAEAKAEAQAIRKAGFYRSLPVAESKVEPYALPYYAAVSPSYYSDGDIGYTWEGLALSYDHAVRQALEACHRDNGRPYIDSNGQHVPGCVEGLTLQTTDPDDPLTTVHVCEPDFKALGLAVANGLPSSSEALRIALEIAGAL